MFLIFFVLGSLFKKVESLKNMLNVVLSLLQTENFPMSVRLKLMLKTEVLRVALVGSKNSRCDMKVCPSIKPLNVFETNLMSEIILLVSSESRFSFRSISL